MSRQYVCVLECLIGARGVCVCVCVCSYNNTQSQTSYKRIISYHVLIYNNILFTIQVFLYIILGSTFLFLIVNNFELRVSLGYFLFSLYALYSVIQLACVIF